MTEIFRTLLLIVLAGTAVTFVAIFASWWFEGARRLQRALKRVLGGPPQGEALSPAQGRAIGLNFDTESLAILWNTGASGLVYGFHEIEGAELIVDGRVVARAQRGEARRYLDDLAGDAERVALRLVFDDPRFPEFELDLFGPGSILRDAADGIRLGRRWLAHVEAVLRRPQPRVAAPDETDDDED